MDQSNNLKGVETMVVVVAVETPVDTEILFTASETYTCHWLIGATQLRQDQQGEEKEMEASGHSRT